MSPTFRSLAIYNYRVYAAGALISNVGTWMGRVAQDWLVLTELTPHSSVALGIVTGLQFLPLLLLAPWSGMIADRFSKRRILALTQSSLALTSALTGVLVITGTVELWHVYVLAFLQGVATAVDNPARQTFVSEMVPREELTNAVGLNSASFNAARLIGPGVAGLLIAAAGTGPAFLINTLTFVAVLVALWRLRTGELKPAPRARGKGQIIEGVRYVRSRPDIMLIMAIVFVLGTFGMNFQLTTALMATSVFHKGAGEYGLLGSIMAIGSLSAALLSARRPRPRLRILLAALAGFVASTLAAALAPSYLWFAVALVPVGLSALTVLTSANSMVQLSVAPHMRGRVMALYMAIFMGGTPLGSPLVGWIGSAWGPRWTILIGTITVAGALVAATLYLMRTENLHLEYRWTGRPRVVLVREPAAEPMPEIAA
ncbi:MFS transporter [Oryzihumus leptocrescens]|uniref:Putative MFS family arabinose efflux permease n=1 Tax=Oryzihumus leptocrescens TaxID=297536 RepID=A0A542ZEV5_9MICO|nr:MFS transporter [Oryzihumus leptocrescens]TQL58872.1 putative MFS family arabinose efflux permease [Oryzihumus leptocrescens]